MIELSLLKEIITEEFHRNLLMQRQYEVEIKKLPKGTIVIKKVGNNEYAYLKYRNGRKTITDYIGRDQDEIRELKKQIQKRRHFERMLSELKKEVRFVEKITGGIS